MLPINTCKLNYPQISWFDQQPPLLVSTGLLEGFVLPQYPICSKSSKVAQDMETDNKSFIMLDRWKTEPW